MEKNTKKKNAVEVSFHWSSSKALIFSFLCLFWVSAVPEPLQELSRPQERTEFGHRHVNLSKLQEIMENGEACHAAVHGVSESPTRLRDWTPTSRESSACWWGLITPTNELLIVTVFQDNTLYLIKALLPWGIAIVTDKSIICNIYK